MRVAPNRKLNKEQVLEIKRRLRDGESSWKIKNDTPVTWKAIKRIERGETYKEIELED